MKSFDRAAVFATAVLAVLSWFGAPALAAQGASQGSNGSQGSGSGFAGPDDVGSLPAAFSPTASLRLVGMPHELAGALRSLSGSGFLLVYPADAEAPFGPIVVELVGDVTLRLSRAALAESSIAFAFHAGSSFGAGGVQLGIGGGQHAPFALHAETDLPLPLAAWFAPGPTTPPFLTLLASGDDGYQYGALALARDDVLLLLQRETQ